MVRKPRDSAKSRASAKSSEYLHFPIRLFGTCEEKQLFHQVVVSAMFMFAENLKKSTSERLSDRQLPHAFSVDALDVPEWCDTTNNEHFYFFTALKLAGFKALPQFDFDSAKQEYDSYANGSRIVAIHKSVFQGFERDSRINSMFDFRIYCAIKAILGRNNTYRYIPSIWIRYGFWGGTAKDTKFKSQLPSKAKTLKSICRLEKRSLVHKFTDHNKSYLSTKLEADEIMKQVAIQQAKKEFKEEQVSNRKTLEALKEKYKSQLNAAEAAAVEVT